jgi:hypothetical protein
MKLKSIILLLSFLLLAALVLGPLSAPARAESGRRAVDDAYTVGLLHMDDDLYGFYDEIGITWSSGGAPFVDLALYKFPSGSGAFTGDDYLYTAADLDYQFGAGDWTIDLWIYVPTTPAVTQYLYWYGDEADDTDSTSIALLSDLTVQAIICEGITCDTFTSTPSVPLTTWTHVAAARSGTDFYVFVGGVASADTTALTIGVPASSPVVEIGARYGGTSREGYFVGHLDEFRISKGVARWTSDYTPPSAEYQPAPEDTGSPTETFTPTFTFTPTETLTPTLTSTPNYDVLYLNTGTPIAIVERSFTWGEVSLSVIGSTLCMVILLALLITGSIWAVNQRKKG